MAGELLFGFGVENGIFLGRYDIPKNVENSPNFFPSLGRGLAAPAIC